MIRLVLSAADLMRIRVGPPASPFDETMRAAALVRERSGSLVFGAWQRNLKGRLGPDLRPLAAICPAGHPGLDLSTLVGRVDTVEEGVERFLAAGPPQVRSEIGWLSRTNPAGSWPWQRLDSDIQLRRELGAAITTFHDTGVRPHWRQVSDFLHAEQSYQAQRIATVGINGFLAAVCPPLLRWRPPVLDIVTAAHGEWHLNGQGLNFVPAAFLTGHVTVSYDPSNPDGAPTLAYPAARDLAAARLFADPVGSQPLAALIGRTRSAILAAIAGGCGTAELALRVETSSAVVSQHTAVLRRSGLITTRRDGGAVVHNVTLLGASLLTANEPARGTAARPNLRK
jgi:DNA-binding transcriptional ArsR family regulator